MNRGTRAGFRFAILGPLAMLALPGAGFAQPNLTAFSITPNTINTASASANVTLNFTATDSASGVLYFETAFVDPTGVFLQRGSQLFSPALNTVNGSVTITFPAFSNSGTWTVGTIFLLDNAGNTTVLDTATISGLGFPTTLQITSATDSVAPKLTGFSLAPGSIDTTSGPANLAMNFTATDDQSGVKTVQVGLSSPSGASTPSVTVNLTPNTSVSGTANSPFPKFSESGTWTVTSVFVADAVGNTQVLGTADLAGQGFPASFNVTSSHDTQPPALATFGFTPGSIDTAAGPSGVTVNYKVTDDLSGATTFQVGFLSPSGANTALGSATFPANVSMTGTANVPFPKGSETGTWTVASAFVSDAAGNTTTLATGDLVGRGFPTQVTVTNNMAPDVTAQMSVTRTVVTFNRGTGKYSQTVTVTNNGGALAAAAYVADGLPAGVAMTAPSGLTASTSPSGSPFKELGPMGAGAQVTLIIEFTRTGTQAFTYNPRVLGAGPR